MADVPTGKLKRLERYPFIRCPSVAKGGPGGIRTLDLFSAIEARSQLRYRPVSVEIVPDLIGTVKKTARKD